jgi:hypothetical protein
VYRKKSLYFSIHLTILGPNVWDFSYCKQFSYPSNSKWVSHNQILAETTWSYCRQHRLRVQFHKKYSTFQIPIPITECPGYPHFCSTLLQIWDFHDSFLKFAMTAHKTQGKIGHGGSHLQRSGQSVWCQPGQKVSKALISINKLSMVVHVCGRSCAEDHMQEDYSSDEPG